MAIPLPSRDVSGVIAPAARVVRDAARAVAAIRSEPSEIVTLRTGDEFTPLRDEWLDLAAALPHSSYFQTPDWIAAWWETIAHRPPTVIAVWRGSGGALEAIAALSYVRQPLHPRVPMSVPAWINAGTGAGAADHCGWLARPHDRAAVQEWMLRETGSATLLLQNLDPEIDFEPPRTARPVQRTRCPRLLVSSDDRAMGWSPNLRQQLRARTRKLRAEGVTFEWIDPPGVDEQVLDALFALHEDGWSQRHRRSSFKAEQKTLHRRLTDHATAGRGPAAVVAIHHGRPVGVVYGFWWQEVFAYYQMGWDPTYARFGLGTVLLSEGIRMSASRGGRVFDFLRGTEPFKYRFNAQDRIDTTWLVPRGGSGALLRLSFAGRRLLRSLPGRRTSSGTMGAGNA